MRGLRAVAAMAREIGWLSTGVYATSRLLKRLGVGHAEHYWFYSQPLAFFAHENLVSRRLVCRELGPGDFADGRDDPAVVAYRLAQGAVAVGAFAGEHKVATLWYTPGPYDEDEVRARYLPRPEGEAAWDFGVEIAEDHRLGRAFATLWRTAMASMRGRGLCHSFSRINAVNVASRRAQQSLGGLPIGHAVFLCLGDWQWAWSSLKPRFHISMSRDSRPVYVLAAGEGGE